MGILGVVGLILSLGLLIYLTMKGVNIIIGAIFSSLLLAVTSGMNLQTAMMGNYMDGFTDYFASRFLVFLLGAIPSLENLWKLPNLLKVLLNG